MMTFGGRRPYTTLLRSLVGALLAVLCTSCAGSAVNPGTGTETEPGPVRLGLIIPKSGVYAPIGEDLRRGFQLGLDQRGGKLGGRPVELITVDEGESPETAMTGAQDLLQREHVVATTGVVSSSVALSLRDMFTSAEVRLIISNAGANDLLGSPASDYLWRTSFANAEPNAAIGKHVAEKTTDGSVYLLAADYAAGHEHLEGFKSTFLKAGGKIAGETYTPFAETRDWQPYLSAIQRSGADAVYVFYAGAEAVAFVKQYAQFELRDSLPLYSAGFLTEGTALEAQGDAALGIQTSQNYAPTLDNAANKSFRADYETAYGEAPTAYAVASYDAALVLDGALREIDGQPTAQQISAALTELGTIDSPRGNWEFGDTHNPVQRYYLREVRRTDSGLENAVVRSLKWSPR